MQLIQINLENYFTTSAPLETSQYIQELKNHIDSTYTAHYAQNRVQSTEFIADAGHGEGFCIGNIIKYAQRYGKKAGRNRKDLTKIAHYVIIMLFIHDNLIGDSNEIKWKHSNVPQELRNN